MWNEKIHPHDRRNLEFFVEKKVSLDRDRTPPIRDLADMSDSYWNRRTSKFTRASLVSFGLIIATQFPAILSKSCAVFLGSFRITDEQLDIPLLRCANYFQKLFVSWKTSRFLQPIRSIKRECHQSSCVWSLLCFAPFVVKTVRLCCA